VYRCQLVPFILCFGALSASAQNIITVTGPQAGNGNFQGAGQSSWTQTGTYTGVTIQATIESCFGTATGTAYLTLNGTAAGNQVAVNNSLSVTPTSAVVTVFSGLTLGPGTYYLTLVGSSSNECAGLIWQNIASGSTTVTVASGVTAGSSGGSNSGVAAYPPASSFTVAQSFLYSVSGTASTGTPSPTPAPPTWILLGTALLLMSAYWCVKRYRQQPVSNPPN